MPVIDRAAKEGMTDIELEIFDLLKKENLTKDEVQRVKLGAKSLLHKLKEDKPTVLITDWYKDNQTRFQVLAAIKKVLMILFRKATIEPFTAPNVMLYLIIF